MACLERAGSVTSTAPLAASVSGPPVTLPAPRRCSSQTNQACLLLNTYLACSTYLLRQFANLLLINKRDLVTEAQLGAVEANRDALLGELAERRESAIAVSELQVGCSP